MQSNLSQTSMLVEAARLYYEHQFSQQQIANKLGVSRPGVSRLLQQARNRGIIRIEIIDPARIGTQLEARLLKKFDLKKVVVVPNGDEDAAVVKRRLGQAAANMLDQLVAEGIILSVSWGTTMQEVARQVRSRAVKDMIVVQLNGGISRAEYDTHASEIAQKIGEKYRAIPFLLPLPAVVDRPNVKQAIVSDKNIARTLELARNAKVAIFTVGYFDYDSVLVKADYFEPQEVDDLLEVGAVGDVCSRIINYHGKICSDELNSRTIGIELEELRNKPYSIAVAGGRRKFQAIKAALRGRLFNVLITDEWVARELVEE